MYLRAIVVEREIAPNLPAGQVFWQVGTSKHEESTKVIYKINYNHGEHGNLSHTLSMQCEVKLFIKILSFALIIFFYFSFDLSGQHRQTIDSLHSLLFEKGIPEDSNKVELYYEFASKISQCNISEAGNKTVGIIRKGFELSLKINYQKGINDFIYHLKYCFNINDEDPFIKHPVDAEHVNRNTLRLLHQKRNRSHGGTVDHMRIYLDRFPELEMYKEASMVTFWQGLLYYDYDNFKRARSFFYRAENFAQKVVDSRYISKIYQYIGASYYYESRYDSAAFYFKESENIALINSDTASLIFILNNYGETLYQMHNYEEALSSFEKAAFLCAQTKDSTKLSACYAKAGKSCLPIKKYDKALSLLSLSNTLATSTNDYKRLYYVSYLFSELYAKTNNFKISLDYLHKYSRIKDSLFVHEVDILINEREDYWINSMGREMSKKTHEQIEKQMYSIELDKNKVILYLIISGLVLLLIFGFLIFRAYRNAKRLNTIRNRFFSIISHDLRGTFSSFILLLEPIVKKAENLSKEQIINYSVDMEEQARKSYLLLDNLLYWAKSEQKFFMFHATTVNLKELTDLNIALFHVQAKMGKIKLSSLIQEDILIAADKNMLDLVLRNLLSNALKFTGEGGTVIINAAQTTDYVSISITDTGEGLSNDEIKNIFDYSSKKMNQKSNSGLGLVLCKEFVKRHKGVLKVTSKGKGHGSCFTFSLPIVNKGIIS